jgi:hypothetical protein
MSEFTIGGVSLSDLAVTNASGLLLQDSQPFAIVHADGTVGIDWLRTERTAAMWRVGAVNTQNVLLARVILHARNEGMKL